MATRTDRTDLLTPVGRLVAGSLYKAQTTDAEGRPLVIKSGPQAGQPRVDFFFALAIPKGQEQHWSQTPWGQKIWAAGHAAFPQGQGNAPTFAWKVTDGDSQVPNSLGKKPCDREGYKGNWVLAFSSGFAPKIYNADGSQQLLEENAVKLGYYVQVFGSVSGNGSLQQPGVFLNHGMVALSAYGPEIVVGPDAAAVGFGGGALPAGASAVPVSAPFNPAPPAGSPVPAVGAPYVPTPAAAVTPPAMTPAVVAAATVVPPIVPNPAILQPPPPPAAPARVMLPAAQGATYEAMVAAGWTDALLIQHGMMQA